MAEVKIGGKAYGVPVLTLGQIRKTARLASRLLEIEAAGTQDFQMVEQAMDVAIEVIGVWLEKQHPELTAEFIEDHMTIDEVRELGPTIRQALSGSGVSEAGESRGAAVQAEGAASGSASTSNSTASSPSLSPQAVPAETGTP